MKTSTANTIIILMLLVFLYRLGAAQPAAPALAQPPTEQAIALVSAPVAAQEAPTAAMPAPTGAKSVVTEAMTISADFYATGSPAWASQGGMHYGVDYNAPHGSPVFMPFDCAYLMTGYYGDEGKLGYYLMCHIVQDGYEYYSGHLENVQPFSDGQIIPAGTLIGFTNEYDHTHVQLRDTAGNLADFQQYYATH